jgi:hypothetical protein
MGMFLGFSHEHSSLVPLVLNLSTGHVSPQYHVIFDDNFETVPSLNSNASDIDDKFATLFKSSREFYLDQISDNVDFTAPPRDAMVSEGDATVPEGDATASEGDQFDFFDNPPNLPRRSRSTQNRAPAYSATALLAAASLPLAMPLHTWAELPAGVMNAPKRHPSFAPNRKLAYRDLAEASLINSSWTNVASAFTAGYSGSSLLSLHLFNPNGDDSDLKDAHKQHILSMIEPDLSDSDGLYPESMSPFIFAVKLTADSEDNPSYDEATNEIYKHEYTEAAKVELTPSNKTLTVRNASSAGAKSSFITIQAGRFIKVPVKIRAPLSQKSTQK